MVWCWRYGWQGAVHAQLLVKLKVRTKSDNLMKLEKLAKINPDQPHEDIDSAVCVLCSAVLPLVHDEGHSTHTMDDARLYPSSSASTPFPTFPPGVPDTVILGH